jgi:zinc resistance-associated protein
LLYLISTLRGYKKQLFFSLSKNQLNLMEVKMKNTAKGILILTVVAIFGITTLAFAGWGQGYGHMMGPDSWGPGMHSGNGYDQEGYYVNLSADEIAKLDQQRSEYFKATENVRQNLYEKELALRSELAKEDPDTSKASTLQSDISKLQSTLDQERLNYEIKARKSAPNYNSGQRGYGTMMGYGPRGGGSCMW